MCATRADGASIALRGSDGGFTCQASVGMAPGSGQAVDLRRGLSAECILTSSLVHCRDTRQDSRVDPDVLEDLGSTVLLPLFQGNVVTGILAVFSREPFAFAAEDIQRLRQIGADFAAAADTSAAPLAFSPADVPSVATVERRSRRGWQMAAVCAAAVLLSFCLGYWRAVTLTRPTAHTSARPSTALAMAAPAAASALRQGRVEVLASAVDTHIPGVFAALSPVEAHAEVPYPATALREGKHGAVVLKGKLARDGRIADLSVLAGDEVFARDAAATISHWRYKPPAGQSEQLDIVITVNFIL